MSKINYELVYKVRAAGLAAIGSKEDMQHSAAIRAREVAGKEYEALSEKMTKILGTDDWEVVSGYSCMADGIHRHVYSPTRGKAIGVGHRKCVFCGLDDFDD